jgi:hypothetical protein
MTYTVKLTTQPNVHIPGGTEHILSLTMPNSDKWTIRSYGSKKPSEDRVEDDLFWFKLAMEIGYKTATQLLATRPVIVLERVQ